MRVRVGEIPVRVGKIWPPSFTGINPAQNWIDDDDKLIKFLCRSRVLLHVSFLCKNKKKILKNTWRNDVTAKSLWHLHGFVTYCSAINYFLNLYMDLKFHDNSLNTFWTFLNFGDSLNVSAKTCLTK